MKIYTRTGDDGSTGLVGGSRTRKSDARIECFGTVDELNAHLGFAAAALADLNDAPVRDDAQTYSDHFELPAAEFLQAVASGGGTRNYPGRLARAKQLAAATAAG